MSKINKLYKNVFNEFKDRYKYIFLNVNIFTILILYILK